jgi:alpha-mannosidase
VPHTGDWRDASSYREGTVFNMKPIAIHRVNNGKQLKKSGLSSSIKDLEKSSGISFMSISPKNVLLSTLKLPHQENQDKDIDVVILRIYESEGKTVNSSIRFHFPIKSASFLNLMEEDNIDTKEKISIGGPNNNTLDFIIHPFKIITIRVVFDLK